MKGTSCFRCGAVLLFCLLAIITMWAQAGQPSLADVARQKSAAKAKRVVTNDEIPPSPEADKPPSSGSTAVPVAPPDVSAAKKGDAAKSAVPPEKQAKLQELLTERGKLQRVLAALQEKLKDSGNDEQRRAVMAEVVQHTTQEVEENQKQIDQLLAAGAEETAPGPAAPADKPAPAPASPK